MLIAGATGLIGQELVLHLLNKGYQLTVLSRNFSKARKIFGVGVEIYDWYGRGECGKILDYCDVIINLAGANVGAKTWTNKYKAQLLNSRTKSIENLAAIINKLPKAPDLWMQASAIGYYGYDFDKEVDETGQQGEGFLANLVVKWEQSFNAVNLPNTSKLIFRLGLVLSENGGVLKQLLDPLKYGMAICPGNGKNYISCIDIDELLKFVEQAIEGKKYPEVVNLVSDTPVRMIDFVNKIKKQQKGKLLIKVPDFALKLMLGTEKANELVLANQRVISKYKSN